MYSLVLWAQEWLPQYFDAVLEQRAAAEAAALAANASRNAPDPDHIGKRRQKRLMTSMPNQVRNREIGLAAMWLSTRGPTAGQLSAKQALLTVSRCATGSMSLHCLP